MTLMENSKKYDEMDFIERGWLMGKLYGYPDCCIKEMVEYTGAYGLHVLETRGRGNPFMGTGFIPCEKCWNIPYDTMLKTINEKRHPDLEPFMRHDCFENLMAVIEKYYN